MGFRGVLAGAALALGVFGAASSAQASTVLITNVDGPYGFTVATVGGQGSFNSGGIVFTDDLTNQFLVFCVDLQHTITLGPKAPPLTYTKAELEWNGAGGLISIADSNRIGQLAGLGRYFVSTNAPDLGNKLKALQAAIWAISYSTSASFGNATLDGYYNTYIGVADNGRGRASALLAHGRFESTGTQNMVTGGVPEPATWVMMIGGFALAGGALRRRRTIAA